MRCGFSIKKPGKGRKSFSVHKKMHLPNGKVEQPLVKDEAIDTINLNYQRKIMTLEEAFLQIKTLIIPRLKKESGVKDKVLLESLISQKNWKVFKEYWAQVYELKQMASKASKDSARYHFLVALTALEPLSLLSSTAKEMQLHLNDKFDANVHKRYVGRLNTLLRFLGRGFIIHAKRRPKTSVRHVTWKEFQQILASVQDETLKSLYITLFSTGCRMGEVFVLKPRDLKANGTIYIHKQLRRDMEISDIKNSTPHHTIILEEGQEAFLKWAEFDDKESYRKKSEHPLMIAAKKTFKDKDRHISPHDLRHSYAIHMLGLGVPLDRVAKLLGDTVRTVEEHYAGFVMQDAEVDFVKRIIKSNKT